MFQTSENTKYAAAQLLRELESNRLDVKLVPVEDPQHYDHRKRAVEGRNAAWYRELCAEYETNRTKPRVRKDRKGVPYSDTAIKRAAILRVLRLVSQGREVSGVNAERLEPYIIERAEGVTEYA